MSVAITLQVAVNPLSIYTNPSRETDAEQPIFRCHICGCTYDSIDETCTECWGDRLVRIR